MNKSKKKIIICIMIIVILVVIFILGLVANENNKKNIARKKIILTAEKFYTDYYYDTFENKEILKRFEKNGIVLSLYDLLELELISSDEYKKYNLEKTKITIFPKKPYDKESIEVSVVLVKK